MTGLNHRLPSDLVRLIAHRLTPFSGPDVVADSNRLAELTNAEISRILQEMLESPDGQSPSLKRHISLLTEEEERQKELLLRQIRMQTTKLTLKPSALAD